MMNSYDLITQYENNPISKLNRLQKSESSKISLTVTNSSLINESKNKNDLITIQLYNNTKKLINRLNEKVKQLENDINDRDQIIEKLVCYQQKMLFILCIYIYFFSFFFSFKLKFSRKNLNLLNHRLINA